MRDIPAEKDRVLAAAAQLRHDAIQERYDGAGPPDTAFGIASVLDLLAVKWVDLDDETRDATLTGITHLAGPPTTVSP